MSDRETMSVKLPVSGKEVVLKKYLIGRERRALANVYIDKGIEMKPDGSVSKITSALTDAAQDLAWKTVVLSIDGQSENIVEAILDLVSDDYDFIVGEVNNVTANKAATEKKTI